MTNDGGAGPLPMLVVAAAMVGPAGLVLVQRRPAGKSHAGLWEFPGGKVEPGERIEDALARELAEELGVVVDATAMEPIAFATKTLPGGSMVLLLHLVRRWRGEPHALHADAIAWHPPTALPGIAMPPADVALIDALCRMIGPTGAVTEIPSCPCTPAS